MEHTKYLTKVDISFMILIHVFSVSSFLSWVSIKSGKSMRIKAPCIFSKIFKVYLIIYKIRISKTCSAIVFHIFYISRMTNSNVFKFNLGISYLLKSIIMILFTRFASLVMFIFSKYYYYRY